MIQWLGTALSDYAPIAMRWAAEPVQRVPRVPDWVAWHPKFAETVDSNAPSIVCNHSGSVWGRLRAHIGVLHLASNTLHNDLREPAKAESSAWRFHWLCAPARGVRRGHTAG